VSRAAVVKRWAPTLTILAALALTAWAIFSLSGPRAARDRSPAAAPAAQEPTKRPLASINGALVS
jgi:hypothetical protein